MSSDVRDPNATASSYQEDAGLDQDELRAEQAGELPARDAMSIIGVGGIEGGLPSAGLLDGLLDADPTDHLPPIGELPVEPYPADGPPIQFEPQTIVPPMPPVIEPPVIAPPIAVSPLDPPVDSDPISIPEPLDASAGAAVEI